MVLKLVISIICPESLQDIVDEPVFGER